MKIYLAQLNPTVGALESNRAMIADAYAHGVAAGADIVMVPELAVTGYPPRDLLDNQTFVDANLAARDSLVAMTGDPALIFGCVVRNTGSHGKPLRNVAVVAKNGRVLLEQAKSLLPTYDVFDELRYFEPADEVHVIELCGRKVGISVCEDFWFEEELHGKPLYSWNPIESLAEQGAEIMLNISASPFSVGKRKARHQLFRGISERFGVPAVYVNQVGGNDELLFDGSSLVLDARGRSVFCGESFATHETIVALDGPACAEPFAMPPEEEIGRALILGLRDYLRKCGFKDVVIGLSGGVDSAVTATLAVDALGREHVIGIAMPSPFSSQGSVDDARVLASNLGIRFHVAPINEIYQSYRKSFDLLFGDHGFDITDENVQARIRGNLLMAWSNKTGAMVLSTGNKSEIAVGYCTLYGDMAGGLALLGDVYKTTVYKITAWLNRDGERIPRSTVVKPPSAELRPNQTDQDSLPPYEILDGILRLYIEQWQEEDAIVAAGYDRTTVARILRMVDGNEFKRRQAAPTIRVSSKAFGDGRQMPIAQRWRDERVRNSVRRESHEKTNEE
jgi:NAD+ synthetase